MSSTAFQRTPLAMAVCAALFHAPAHAAPDPVDDPAPGDPLTLYTADNDLRLQNFDVAALPDGRFAVAWLERNLDNVNETIKLARFDSTGAPIGGTQTVYSDPSSSISLSNPVMAADADGDLVVAWEADVGGNDCTDTVAYILLPSEGMPGIMQWAPDSSGMHCDVALAVNQDGAFVLGWTLEDPENNTERFQYQIRRFNADGTPMGDSQTLAQAGNTLFPMALAMHGDTWLAAWSAYDNGQVLQAQRFNINGTALDQAPFRLDDGSQQGASLSQVYPTLMADEDGGFVGVWHQMEAVDSQPVTSVQGQRRRADGTAGAGFLIANDTEISMPIPPLGLALYGDQLLTTWSDWRQDQPPVSLVAGVDGDASVGAPVPIVSGDEDTVDYSLATRVVITDAMAALVWFQRQDGEAHEIKALVQPLPESPDPEPAPQEDDDDNGGATGLLTLLGLGLLALRRRVRR
ncbi:GlyGly-CTERM sorting domain-containing protein [Alloalcanivorax sp. C16-1]|uniref:GlyGly-CTERM sorting domain-containing protein n=1 Tax=Alloalcanivorax sp. C16-1 TaxID=3390051 RepID=UPI003970D96E